MRKYDSGETILNTYDFIPFDRGYRILVFARDQKKRNAATVPFTYLGPVERISYLTFRTHCLGNFSIFFSLLWIYENFRC
jgi:hypothetical protein